MSSPFRFDNSYVRALPGTYLSVQPDVPPAPRLLTLNTDLAEELGLDLASLREGAADWLSGARLPEGAEPIAQAYAGHQFGGFSPQLGDGRAVLLGEVVDRNGQRRDIQLKGSGRTPFSRGGDGKAAVGPMLREVLIGEALHALGIPTTRALAVVATGAPVLRDGPLPGAVLTRVAASHLRVGTFQFFAARSDHARVKALMEYTIARHYPEAASDPVPALALFDHVVAAQTRLIARWMGVGFVHGVMNTDNMALSGESIDFGPCAFLDAYSPGAVFSSIDHGGRYAYANQPLILAWNLARLAEALLPFFDADPDRAVDLANDRLTAIADGYRREWTEVMRGKLALDGAEEGDAALADDLLSLMAGQGADWTLTFHSLAAAADGQEDALRAQIGEGAEAWLRRWRTRLAADAPARLRSANPRIIARNDRVEAALSAATAGDLGPFEALLAALRQPFSDDPALDAYAAPPPGDFGPYVTFCGT